MSEHDWVRRLLAEEGRTDEPMPAEVADRLDRVLAGLAAEAAEAPAADPAPVVPMTPRRQRRWGAALLAAAAVTLGGYTLTAGEVLDRLGGSTAGKDATAGSAVEPGGERRGASAADRSGEQAPEAAGQLQDDARLATLPALSSATLERDASRLARTVDSGVAGSATGRDPEQRAYADGPGACVPPPPVVRGLPVAVTLDGEPATAVVRPRDAGGAVVQVWSCEAPVRLARVLVDPAER